MCYFLLGSVLPGFDQHLVIYTFSAFHYNFKLERIRYRY